MPCESCNIQFNVFKKKRSCTECRRLYCNQCLTKRNDKCLCKRCIIFTTRPLSKVDLLKLKPKDLIFYLQSKHVSTTGCVEKEELVNLVLAHASVDGNPMSDDINFQPTIGKPNQDDSENCSNPFDQIKQTCQNLFNSFTEKISNDLGFEAKSSPSASNSQHNIFTQPRMMTREMPTYSSSLGKKNHQKDNQPRNSVPNNNLTVNINEGANVTEVPATSSSGSTSSPTKSFSSISSQSTSPKAKVHIINAECVNGKDQASPSRTVESIIVEDVPSVHTSASNKRLFDNVFSDSPASDCECSDDEVMTKFQSRYRMKFQQQHQKNEKTSPISQSDSAFEDQIPGPSGSVPGSGTNSKSSSGNRKSSGESSNSSFEELGAVGGGHCAGHDNEHWQFVQKVEVSPYSDHHNQSNDVSAQESNPSTFNSDEGASEAFQEHSSTTNLPNNGVKATQTARRLVRRRSDGYVNRNGRYGSATVILSPSNSNNVNLDQIFLKRSRKNCYKCGKSKRNLKQYVAKFQRQLQSAQMSESDIKREVQAFLKFLEKHSAESFDESDSESNLEHREHFNRINSPANINERNTNRLNVQTSRNANDDGIHVYAHNSDDVLARINSSSRFINLGNFSSSSELEDLSVKQLKEILMLNRVDYKGCCEKKELLERVNRLWKDLQTGPAIEKLPTDDLCKICMDAPIECVILECGHMATCTNCGKVLSECPICRQYIVRVVRFFRA